MCAVTECGHSHPSSGRNERAYSEGHRDDLRGATIAVHRHSDADRERRVSMTKLNINGKSYDVDLPEDTPLLWTLRDQLGLTGTKFGCGMALCGACTVHVDGRAVRSCITPISAVANSKIVTIEAVGGEPVGKALQAA